MKTKSTKLNTQRMRDLEPIVRLKARACELLSQRSNLPPEEHRARHQALIKEAKERSVALWMLHINSPNPGQMRDLSNCFIATSDAIRLLLSICSAKTRNGVKIGQGYNLLWEAQSLLRTMVSFVSEHPDEHQIQAFYLLPQNAGGSHLTDQPLRTYGQIALFVDDLRLRMAKVAERLNTAKRLDRLFMKIRKLLASHPRTKNSWRLLAKTFDQLAPLGVNPSNKELRTILLPSFDKIAALRLENDFFNLVVENLREHQTRLSANATAEPTPAVAKVRSMFKGGKMVFICGDLWPAAKRRLEEAFGLEELIWKTLHHNESNCDFVPLINTKGVAVVLLCTRFCRYHMKDVKSLCESRKISFVMLPAGYNPNQVASEIIKQCGHRMENGPTR